MKLLMLAILAACATQPITKEESKVRILRKSDAPENCQELGRVYAYGLMSVTEQGRENDLKKDAFKLGGDTVTILNRDENNTIFGMAYKCQR